MTRLRVTLVDKFPASMIIQREDLLVDLQEKTVPYPQYVYVDAYIDPSDHPATHPARQTKELGNSTVTVKSTELGCQKRSTSVPADFHNWGHHPQATVTRCDAVPGGVVRMILSTRFDESKLGFDAELVDYHSIVRE